MRWIAHGVLLVALAVGIFGVLPRLGGLTRDAAGLRHARPGFLVVAVVAQAVSLGCYALLYRQVLARELWLVTAWREPPDGAPQPVSYP